MPYSTQRLSWRTAATAHPFDFRVFLVATLVAAAILVTLVAVPQWLSRKARWEEMRSHVAEIGQLAAGVVDGDLHRRLLDPANYSAELYARALKPMVRLHSADPNIFYLYTMVQKDDGTHFVLDTATSPELKTSHQLQASPYMEKFELRDEYEDGWLKQIADGDTYVTPTYQQDEYGNFLTAHTPIYDSEGRYSGFVGVDFDLQFYLTREAQFRAIAVGSLLAALLVALAIGYGVSVYYSTINRRMQELYENSIRDGLTGLLNRRGAMDATSELLAKRAKTYAALLIDVDGLKIINDMRGHATGDAIIARTSEAVRESIREGDQCARLGGDEFFIFAANCDRDGAMDIARRILAKLTNPLMPLSGARSSVSIGISVVDGDQAEFSRMYHEADMALYEARADGKSRIGVYMPPDDTRVAKSYTRALAL